MDQEQRHLKRKSSRPSATRCWIVWPVCRRNSTTPASARLREQQDFREFAAADVIKNFLPILDSFERALKVEGDSSDFRNGIELIYRQFQDALQKIGVQRILSAGQPFDPRIHEAVEMVDTTEVPDHYVLDELQHGYKYKDRLLRPAMVRVARNSRG